MRDNWRFSILSCLILCGGCSTLHIGAGTNLGNGRSGGCPVDSGTSVIIESSWYTSAKSGPGIGVKLFSPGFTDCNDRDPLIILSPNFTYRHFLGKGNSPHALALLGTVGYITGIFVDPGYSLAFGGRYYINKLFYFSLNQGYYRAFGPKKSAIKPGTSYLFNTQFTLGIHFGK